jgi:hypothetical protein
MEEGRSAFKIAIGRHAGKVSLRIIEFIRLRIEIIGEPL